MKIHFLSEETYEKISAGEVIENPASALRELIDNSIDAKANDIKILIIEGGKTLIQIKDNGLGMSFRDLDICYKKYTTSKIKEFDDIYNISSLGFRGEGLNSIAVISELEIISKTNDEDVGNSILLRGGKTLERKRIAKNNGTVINVKNIFYNIPVRRKSLKQSPTEFRYIKEAFISKTLPFNNIRFTLKHNEREIFNTSNSDTRLIRIRDFFGKSMADALVYFEEEYVDYKVSGYLSKPNFFRKNRRYQYTYINGRPIFSPTISVAITDAYKTITPIGSYPFVFIFLEIPPSLIDINTHPAKKDVKILNTSSLYDCIKHSIESGIQIKKSLPKIEFRKENGQIENGQIENTQKLNQDYRDYANIEPINNVKTIATNDKAEEKIEEKIQKDFMDTNAITKSFFKTSAMPFENTKTNYNSYSNGAVEKTAYRVLGTLFNTYVLIEDKEDFIMLDQHAAHERLQYEKIKSKITNDTLPSQKLLKPFIIDIPPANIDNMQEKQDSFKKLGFEMEIFGNDCCIISSIPYFLKMDKAKEAIDTLIENIFDNKDIPSSVVFVEELLKMKACKSAIKAGNLMSEEEIISLLDELALYKNPFACPHGRPTALRLDKTEIERLFLRRT